MYRHNVTENVFKVTWHRGADKWNLSAKRTDNSARSSHCSTLTGNLPHGNTDFYQSTTALMADKRIESDQDNWQFLTTIVLQIFMHIPVFKANSAFHPSSVGKWVPASAGKAKAGMVHSVSGWMRGVQVKLWDPLRTCAIPECLRGVFMTRHYTNPRLPLPLQYQLLSQPHSDGIYCY